MAQRVTAEAERELAYDADGELSSILVGEQVGVGGLAGGVRPEDFERAERERFQGEQGP